MNRRPDASNPADREALRQELLELHFGCHEDPARLEAALAADPELRALQQDVLAQANVLTAAVRPEQAPLRLQPPAQAPRRAWRTPSGRIAAVVAAAAAAALVVVLGEQFATRAHDAYQREHLHLTVSAPRAVPAGAAWNFTVETRDLTGTPVEGRVRWEAYAANGAMLASSEVSTHAGQAVVTLPAAKTLQQPTRLLVEAATATDRAREILQLSATIANPLVHVALDRPIYRPGESVFVRTVVLDRLSRTPLPGARVLSAQLRDAKGTVVAYDRDGITTGGVASFRLAVPENSPGGPHTVEVVSDDHLQAPERAELIVRTFQTPQLQKRIELDRTSYLPGARGVAVVNAQRLAAGGGGASGAACKGTLLLDGREVWSQQGTLDARGDATFTFTVPNDVERGAARFVATIDDGGIIETELKPFVVPTGKLQLAAFPEGGELVAGVDNTVYLELTDPLGRPVDGTGALLDERDRSLATFRTVHQGRAKLAFVPRAGARYRVRVQGQAEPFALPDVQERGVALVLRGDDIAADAPLRLGIAGRGAGPWLLGVFCRGMLVGQQTLRAGDDGELRAEAELALPASAIGVLRATVFDRTLQPVAERLVRRLGRERIDVALTPQQPTRTPGERQQIAVRTTDESGAGRASVVGLSVTDAAVHAMASEPSIGLLDHALLFADVEKGEDLGDFLLGHAEVGTHVDLLLGTRGWRRFLWRNDAAAQAAIAGRGPDAATALAREGLTQTPQVASNLEAARTGGEALARATWRWERRRVDTLGLAGVAIVLLLVAEVVAWLLRRAFRAPPLLQGSLGAIAAAALFVIASLLQIEGLPKAAVYRMQDRDFAPPAEDFVHSNAAKPGEWLEWNNRLPVTGSDDFGPRSNPLAGAFYNDGGAGDVRARTENYFAKHLAYDEFDRAAVLLGRADDGPASAAGSSGVLELTEELVDLSDSREAMKQERGARAAQNWRERQYAHRHTASDTRNDFAPTLYWNTLLITDAQGNATAAFDTSDAVTTWRVHADAHAPQGPGRLGQATTTFTTRLPLSVEAKLPDEVAAGDRLQLPITLLSTDPSLREATLNVTLGDGLRADGTLPTRLLLDGGRGRVLVPITVLDQPGVSTLGLDVQAGRFTDRLRHRLVIAPRGFPHRRSLGGSVTPNQPATLELALPNDAVPGSGHVTLTVYPSPLASLRGGLDGMLREPCGCFEQTSSANYPNTLVLTLLQGSGDAIPAAAVQARQLLAKGYARLVGFECKRGGFEWFGHDPGHEALTAYGLLQFHDMAKVFDVDRAIVERTARWLLGRRNGKGDFVHEGQDHHSFGGNSRTLTNAYCTLALLQTGTPASELAAELQALRARTSIDDPYELALLASALQLAGDPAASSVRQRLAELQRADGSLHGTTTSITCSSGRDLVVETTALAVQAWLGDPAFAGHVRKALDHVLQARDAGGTFGATQATVQALRAIVGYAQAQPRARTGGALRLLEGDRELLRSDWSPDATEPLVFELWSRLAPGSHTLRLELDAKDADASLPWACDVRYHGELPADDPDAPCALTTTLRSGIVAEGATVALDVVLGNRTDRELPTPIAVVGLPAGCELPTRVLEDLMKQEAFAFWELRGRELVLYWRKLDAGAEHTVTLDLIARVPGTSSGPASRAWLYYAPGQKRWAAPLQLTVQAK